MSATLTIKPDLKAKLETLANVMHRDQSELANEAIGLYVERETLLLEKIRNGLAQAERGEFVPDGEMDAFFAEHGFIVEPLGFAIPPKPSPTSQRSSLSSPGTILPPRDGLWLTSVETSCWYPTILESVGPGALPEPGNLSFPSCRISRHIGNNPRGSMCWRFFTPRATGRNHCSAKAMLLLYPQRRSKNQRGRR